MTDNTMPISKLRDHPLFVELAHRMRLYSMPFSLVPYLGVGGTGTLVKYKHLNGVLTATHVLAENLGIEEIYAPFKATEKPTYFHCDKIQIKRILHLETDQGIDLLCKDPWPENALDICFIEIEESEFTNLLKVSGKNALDLEEQGQKYRLNFEKYEQYPNDWCWGFEGSPRDGVKQGDDNILVSKFDGCYLSGGEFIMTPLVHVLPPYDRTGDLCLHRLGSTLDALPKTFGGASGSGMWQVRLEGNEGILEGINELFFSGVFVAESPSALLSRGPSSLYEIFLSFLNQI